VAISRDILNKIADNIEAYLNQPYVVYERYRQNLQDVEQRNDIRDARVAIYEVTEQPLTRVDVWRNDLMQMTYGIDISVVKAYMNDNAQDAELRLLDLKDMIIDWVNQVNIANLTNSYLYYFAYNTQNGITRNTKYVTCTLSFLAQRDYSKKQNTNLPRK
jgi:hypothetical protein